MRSHLPICSLMQGYGCMTALVVGLGQLCGHAYKTFCSLGLAVVVVGAAVAVVSLVGGRVVVMLSNRCTLDPVLKCDDSHWMHSRSVSKSGLQIQNTRQFN